MRTEFRISSRWQLADPTDHSRSAAEKVAKLFAGKPHAELPLHGEARKIMLGNQVVQSVLAQLNTSDGNVAALHASASGQQGVQAALMAVLDYAAGADTLDAAIGLPRVTVEHVNAARRLVDTSVKIRDMWRQTGADAAMETDADGEDIARPVCVAVGRGAFGAALSTQLPADQGGAPRDEAPAAEEGHAADIWRGVEGLAAPDVEQPDGEAGPHDEVAYARHTAELKHGVLDMKGMGVDGAMMFPLTDGESGFPGSPAHSPFADVGEEPHTRQ